MIIKDIKVGDRIRHWNTAIRPQLDGSTEFKVDRIHTEGAWNNKGEGWWASYHIDKHEPPCAYCEAGMHHLRCSPKMAEPMIGDW